MISFKFTDQGNRSGFGGMQAFRSSFIRLLTIEPSVLSWNKRSDIYSKSARVALSTCSSTADPRRRRFPAIAPPGEEEQEEGPPIDEISQKKHFAEAVERAKGAALRLLSQRSHSRKELITKLEEREHPHDAISSALDRLSEVGLQSDAEFADVFARSKWRQVKWAPAKIKQELTRRGIAPELVREAIESVFGPDGLSMRRYMEEELAEEQLGPWTPAAAPESALLVAASRQYQLTVGLSDEARKRRIVGWLQRRGHSWEVVSRVIKWLGEAEKEKTAAEEWPE